LGLSVSLGISYVLEGLMGLDPAELALFDDPPGERKESVELWVSALALSVLEQFSLRGGLARSVLVERYCTGSCLHRNWGFFGTANSISYNPDN
jgi:hypothetical protein